MPTSAKRLQVLVKPRVLKILEGIAEDENLSLSKVCSLLIEESLITRGAFSKTSRMAEILPDTPERQSVMRKDSLVQAAETAQASGDDDEETMRLLKKFKALKDAGLL
jgi:hypothetical protein